MPLDPLFTSSGKQPLKKPRRVSKKRLLNPDEVFKKKYKKKLVFVSGAPALDGFKQPKKIWDT